MSQIPLSKYADKIHLNVPIEMNLKTIDNIECELIIENLLKELGQEVSALAKRSVTQELSEKRKLLHAVINTLAPKRLNLEFQKQLDQLLQAELKDKEIQTLDDLPVSKIINGTNIVLWKGDITFLEVDAIVNAANSQLLGCFQPLHSCIDNAIHSAAGVQLRDDCYKIMTLQNCNEKTGQAKITRAYNLPSNFVIHTVGPIVDKFPNAQQAELLADCYHNCLEIASQIPSIKSIAFCCISTGVFGYPQNQAATVAVKAVSTWLKKRNHNFDSIVFNVFLAGDFQIYHNLLKK